MHQIVEAKNEDMVYIRKCIKENILLSVDSNVAELSSLWIDTTLNVALNNILNKIMKDEVFLIKNKEEIAGMIWLGISRNQFTCEETGYVLGIFVDKKHRLNGYGKALMEFAESWTKSKGLCELTLNVGFFNNGAKEFYTKLGFKPQSEVLSKIIR